MQSIVRATLLWFIRIFLRTLGIIVDVQKPLKTFPKIGFAGELGYALFGLLPYLNHLKLEYGLKIQTFGTAGSSAFFEFSDEHTEEGVGATSSWGTVAGALRFRKYASFFNPIYVPVEWFPRRLRVTGLPSWESNKLHIQHGCYEAWTIPSMTQEDWALSLLRDTIPGPYCVINIKNYLTWGETYVPNWYLEEDLQRILEYATKNSLKIAINRSPVPADDDEPLVQQPYLEAFLAGPKVIDISRVYESLSVAEGNRFQVALLKNATHIWATQGGNALLALINGSSVSVLMRGGSDFEDYRFFSEMRELDFFEVIHFARQSRLLA